MQPIDRIIRRLESVTSSTSGYMALCPAHDDNNPSLSLDSAEDGRVLVNCFAGCKTKDVVFSIGLEMSDLYPND